MTLEHVALQGFTDSPAPSLYNTPGTEVTTILGKHMMATHINLFVETGQGIIC